MKTIKMLFVLAASIAAFAFTPAPKAATLVSPIAFTFEEGDWSPANPGDITTLCPGADILCGVRYDNDQASGWATAAEIQSYVETHVASKPTSVFYTEGNRTIEVEVFYLND